MTPLTADSPDEAVIARAVALIADDPEPCTYFDRVWGSCGRPAEVDGRCCDHVGGAR